jgi:two-component system, response regulator PdtaR
LRKYLVVDDNSAFAENLAEIITDAGGSVDVAPGGEIALERARSTRYDVLISDMRMPVIGGAELVHRIHRLDPGLPAIVITAYTNDDDLLAARREGLLAVLPKPAPVPTLLELLRVGRRDGLVVLVEDDVYFSDNLSELLRSQGFASVTAASVLETEHLGDVRPFAALVDLRLPGGPDGLAMTRLAEKFPGLPMLVLSGHMDVVPPEPHHGVFNKPFKTPELLEALERLYRAQHVD